MGIIIMKNLHNSVSSCMSVTFFQVLTLHWHLGCMFVTDESVCRPFKWMPVFSAAFPHLNGIFLCWICQGLLVGGVSGIYQVNADSDVVPACARRLGGWRVQHKDNGSPCPKTT